MTTRKDGGQSVRDGICRPTTRAHKRNRLALQRVVDSRGGGVRCIDLPSPALHALLRAGLVRWKPNVPAQQYGFVIHTAEGRAMLSEREKDRP
jgi:hypothetical protein